MKSPLQNIFLQITSYILDQTRKSCVRTVDSGDEWRLAGFFFTFRFFLRFLEEITGLLCFYVIIFQNA